MTDSERQPLLGPTHFSSLVPTPSSPTQNGNSSKDGAPQKDYLHMFREALGITSTSTAKSKSFPRGIYGTLIRDARQYSLQYWTLDVLLTVALVAQLLIGTTLTTLGPVASRHHLAITILSACNTFIAGFLALMKGNGLPDRYRKDGYEIRKVQDYIEEVEGLFEGGLGPKSEKEVLGVVKEVLRRYEEARETVERNRPSSYHVKQSGGLGGGDGGEADV